MAEDQPTNSSFPPPDPTARYVGVPVSGAEPDPAPHKDSLKDTEDQLTKLGRVLNIIDHESINSEEADMELMRLYRAVLQEQRGPDSSVSRRLNLTKRVAMLGAVRRPENGSFAARELRGVVAEVSNDKNTDEVLEGVLRRQTFVIEAQGENAQEEARMQQLHSLNMLIDDYAKHDVAGESQDTLVFLNGLATAVAPSHIRGQYIKQGVEIIHK